jgi:hypothetical protein
VLTLVVRANSRRDKAPTLLAVREEVQALEAVLRLAHHVQAFQSLRSFEHANDYWSSTTYQNNPNNAWNVNFNDGNVDANNKTNDNGEVPGPIVAPVQRLDDTSVAELRARATDSDEHHSAAGRKGVANREQDHAAPTARTREHIGLERPAHQVGPRPVLGALAPAGWCFRRGRRRVADGGVLRRAGGGVRRRSRHHGAPPARVRRQDTVVTTVACCVGARPGRPTVRAARAA